MGWRMGWDGMVEKDEEKRLWGQQGGDSGRSLLRRPLFIRAVPGQDAPL